MRSFMAGVCCVVLGLGIGLTFGPVHAQVESFQVRMSTDVVLIRDVEGGLVAVSVVKPEPCPEVVAGECVQVFDPVAVEGVLEVWAGLPVVVREHAALSGLKVALGGVVRQGT